MLFLKYKFTKDLAYYIIFIAIYDESFPQEFSFFII